MTALASPWSPTIATLSSLLVIDGPIVSVLPWLSVEPVRPVDMFRPAGNLLSFPTPFVSLLLTPS